jgi:HD-GYP domain-containing protein (c-di-GMP phosphodiesterase class II)
MITPPLRSFFSVASDLILIGEPLPYDLFVNSSSLKEREKFVRVFPAGQELEAARRDEMHKKYFQLYVAEDQRGAYLKSLVSDPKVDDVSKAKVLKDSALGYLGRIFDQNREFSTELLEGDIEGCREVVEGMVDLLGEYDVDGLRGLIGNLSFHDFYTFDHSINVSMYTIALWRIISPQATRAELVTAGLGGLLHDLGKMKIPTHILNNPGKLSAEEYDVIKTHPGLGITLLLEGQVKVHHTIDVVAVARIIHEHHENWDGTGYPRKIGAEDIHPMARACTIADFFDAITTKRAYSDVLPVSEALGIMRRTRAHKVEPDAFDKFEAHVAHSKSNLRDIRLAEHFDPTLPWAELPLEETKHEAQEDFGKIRVVGGTPAPRK